MRLLLSALCLTICLLVPACSSGPKTYKVTGTLVNKEKPYTVAAGGGVTLVFIPVDAGTAVDTYPAYMDADTSKFTVEGREGKGMPPGKYRVSIQQMVPGGPPAINDMNERFSEAASPIIVEITDGKTPLVIDLAKTKGN